MGPRTKMPTLLASWVKTNGWLVLLGRGDGRYVRSAFFRRMDWLVYVARDEDGCVLMVDVVYLVLRFVWINLRFVGGIRFGVL